MNSQTARTDFGVRETLGSGGFSPGVVAEVLGRDEEDPGLDILVLGLAGRPCCAEKVRRTDPFRPRWFWVSRIASESASTRSGDPDI